MSGRRGGSGYGDDRESRPASGGARSYGSSSRGAWDDDDASMRRSPRRRAGGYDDGWNAAGPSRRDSDPPREIARPPARQQWDDESEQSGHWRDWDDNARPVRRGGISGDAWQPARPRGNAARTPGRRRGSGLSGGIIGLIVVAVLAVAGVAGYWYLSRSASAANVLPVADSPYTAPTAGPTPAAPTGFKAFDSQRARYGFYYPTVWDQTSKDSTLAGQYDYIDGFTLSNSASHVTIEQAGAFSTRTNADIIKAEVAGAKQNGVTVNPSSTQTPTQVAGGATWDRIDYEVVANGEPLHMAVMATHHAGLGYVIVLVSDAGSFGNDAQAVYAPMLATFHFTK